MKSKFLLIIGLVLVIVSVALLSLIFKDVIKSEFSYYQIKGADEKSVVTESSDKNNVIVAADKNFSVVIPKIGANAKVIENVDPFDSAQYQQALTKGVAMAKGSALPLNGKNTFLFAHSSDNFINANTYNAVFYLLYKLEKDDKVYLVYRGKVIEYKVAEKKYVNADQTDYMGANYGNNTLTLMTCWPAGTTLRRLIIVANLVN